MRYNSRYPRTHPLWIALSGISWPRGSRRAPPRGPARPRSWAVTLVAAGLVVPQPRGPSRTDARSTARRWPARAASSSGPARGDTPQRGSPALQLLRTGGAAGRWASLVAIGVLRRPPEPLTEAMPDARPGDARCRDPRSRWQGPDHRRPGRPFPTRVPRPSCSSPPTRAARSWGGPADGGGDAPRGRGGSLVSRRPRLLADPASGEREAGPADAPERVGLRSAHAFPPAPGWRRLDSRQTLRGLRASHSELGRGWRTLAVGRPWRRACFRPSFPSRGAEPRDPRRSEPLRIPRLP
jgi:hypothetical protein